MSSTDRETVRSGAAIAGYAFGLGATVAAILTVVLYYAAPAFPWLASVLIGVAAGGGVGVWLARRRGIRL